jgi:hypothetical protein
VAQHPSVWQPANRVSIDATPDRALNRARSAYPGAGNHRNVGEAVSNILAGSFPAFGRRGQFIGHGKPGVIFTGGGRPPCQANAYVSLRNASTWVPHLQTLKGEVQVLRLVGCRVGAGQRGADLLHEVACAIGAPVLAPTGFAWTRPHANIVMQDGSVWQIGQCNVEVHPIPMPKAPGSHAAPLALVSPTGERVLVPLAQVSRVEFVREEFFGEGSLSLEGKQAQELVLKARLHEPQVTEWRPLALPTGELTVFYTLDGEEHQRVFVVLADALLEDRDSPGVFYEVTREFEEALPEDDMGRPVPRDRGPAPRR